MARVTTFECDSCHARSSAVGHWFVVSAVNGVIGIAMLDPSYNYSPATLTICGEGCLNLAVHKLLSTLSPLSAPETEPHYPDYVDAEDTELLRTATLVTYQRLLENGEKL